MRKEHKPNSKEYIEKSIDQCFTVLDFKNMEEQGFFKTCDKVTLLHDPRRNATPGGNKESDPNADAISKALRKMNVKDLMAKYVETFNVTPPAGKTKDEVAKAIESKVPFVALDTPEREQLIKKFKEKYNAEPDPEATDEEIQELLK